MESSFIKKTTGCLIFLLVCHIHAAGQKIENVKATLSGDYIVVDYDLSDAPSESTFIIELFSSHNNFSAPVASVSGDVGSNVLAGRSKAIRWYAREELKSFRGEVVVEVRARAVVSVARFALKSPDGHRVKKGRVLSLDWTGGRKEEKIELQLIKDGKALESIASGISNTGTYRWTVPSKARPGRYHVQLKGESGEVMSGAFTIKSRLPLMVKLLPVLVVGAGVYLLTSSGGEPNGGGGSTSNDLPGPPEPN
jgi:hypothetical protein